MPTRTKIQPRLPYHDEPRKPWSQRRLDIIASFVKHGRKPRPAKSKPQNIARKRHRRDIDRLIAEGVLIVEKDGGRRMTLTYVNLAPELRRLIEAAPVSEVRQPYSKRKAAIAEFEAANDI